MLLGKALVKPARERAGDQLVDEVSADLPAAAMPLPRDAELDGYPRFPTDRKYGRTVQGFVDQCGPKEVRCSLVACFNTLLAALRACTRIHRASLDLARRPDE
jgi:hypothetical protein